jgi:hypothetical protein
MAGMLDDGATQPLHALPLSLPRLLRPAGVLWNRHRGLTPSAQLMVSCLEEVAQRMQAHIDTMLARKVMPSTKAKRTQQLVSG